MLKYTIYDAFLKEIVVTFYSSSYYCLDTFCFFFFIFINYHFCFHICYYKNITNLIKTPSFGPLYFFQSTYWTIIERLIFKKLIISFCTTNTSQFAILLSRIILRFQSQCVLEKN